MRPVNQFPWSLNEMKRSPAGSRRMPDSPPKPGKEDVSTSPLRYSRAPNRTREWSCRSNDAIGRAWTSIDTGDGTKNAPGGTGLADERLSACARARSDMATIEIAAAVDRRKRRREKCACSTEMG